jgi:hypothetical protein
MSSFSRQSMDEALAMRNGQVSVRQKLKSVSILVL